MFSFQSFELDFVVTNNFSRINKVFSFDDAVNAAVVISSVELFSVFCKVAILFQAYVIDIFKTHTKLKFIYVQFIQVADIS